jgi:hypothetical protein
MVLNPKQKNNLRMKQTEINGNSLGYNANTLNYTMTSSLQSIVPR